MTELFAFLYQWGDAFAFLVLCAMGLAIIFGMMGVINLAHGEFIMCGAYVTVLASRIGLPLPMAMLCGTLAAGVIGIVLERLIIRHLYHRLFDSIVATWALSLIATQGMLIVSGPSIEGIKTPFGSFMVGQYSFSTYRVVLMAAAVFILLALYVLFMHTRYGVRARATIQNPDMARALGVDTGRIYSLTFGLGAALAGLTGALYAPTTTTVPTMGGAFIVQSFVTVVVGGANILLGAAPAAAILGLIQSVITTRWGQTIGQIGLLITVILVVRLLPKGISGLLQRTSSG
ncbi:MAG: branched-chain amino acid ABC transporter permease [Gammaproteobacteria bacterium]